MTEPTNEQGPTDPPPEEEFYGDTPEEDTPDTLLGVIEPPKVDQQDPDATERSNPAQDEVDYSPEETL